MTEHLDCIINDTTIGNCRTCKRELCSVRRRRPFNLYLICLKCFVVSRFEKRLEGV